MSALELERPWWVPSTSRVPAAWFLGLTGLMLWGEYVSGSYLRFPLLYMFPAGLAAWYSGWMAALAVTLAAATAHLGFMVLDGTHALLPAMGTEAMRATVIAVVVLWLDRLAEHERALQEEIRTLRGRLLPICTFCKSIKNGAGEWERLERFLAKRSQTQFSHCVCPTCRKVHYFGLGGDDDDADSAVWQAADAGASHPRASAS